MRRFLRYVFYRELYRQLRQLGSQERDESADSQPQPAPREQLPVTDGPIETEARLKRVLQEMDPYDFEAFVAELWERMGWQTEVSDAARDRGVDVIARKSMPYEQTTLIQAKRYGPNTTVGSPEVQQYASLKDQYNGVDKVAIVTTNEFTGQARELAGKLNVKLIDGDDLAALIEHREAADLVAEYLDFVHVQEEARAEAAPDEQPAAATPPPVQEAGGTPESNARPASSVWSWLVGLGTVGWVLSLVLIDVLAESALGAVILASWIGVPLGIFMDSRRLPPETDWPAHRWLYLLTSLVWIVAIVPGLVYLWQRHRMTVGAKRS